MVALAGRSSGGCTNGLSALSRSLTIVLWFVPLSFLHSLRLIKPVVAGMILAVIALGIIFYGTNTARQIVTLRTLTPDTSITYHQEPRPISLPPPRPVFRPPHFPTYPSNPSNCRATQSVPRISRVVITCFNAQHHAINTFLVDAGEPVRCKLGQPKQTSGQFEMRSGGKHRCGCLALHPPGSNGHRSVSRNCPSPLPH